MNCDYCNCTIDGVDSHPRQTQCAQCDNAVYCDENCQRLAAPLHVNYECESRLEAGFAQISSPTRPTRKLAPKQRAKFHRVLKEYSQHKLHSGSKRGPTVRDRKQALAIAYSEARKAK